MTATETRRRRRLCDTCKRMYVPVHPHALTTLPHDESKFDRGRHTTLLVCLEHQVALNTNESSVETALTAGCGNVHWDDTLHSRRPVLTVIPISLHAVKNAAATADYLCNHWPR